MPLLPATSAGEVRRPRQLQEVVGVPSAQRLDIGERLRDAYPGDWPPWRKAALERELMRLKPAGASRNRHRS